MKERKEYDIEIWKDIEDYEGLYQISNFGNVKSLDRTIFHKKGFNITLKSKNIKYSKNKDGYCQVNLTKNSKQKCFKISRLVAEHFLNKEFSDQEVNHIDRNKSNNHVNNLEWVTKRENCCHRSKLINNNLIGVTFDKNRNKYSSSIRINKKRIFLGRYNTEKEAYEARKNYELEHGIINKYL